MDTLEQVSWNIWSALGAVDDALAAEWWTVNQKRLASVQKSLHDALRTIRLVQGEINTSPDEA